MVDSRRQLRLPPFILFGVFNVSAASEYALKWVAAMRIVVWSLRLLLFVLLLMVAAYNVQPVSFHFFADTVWEAPLMVMLLIAFVLGVSMMGLVLSVRLLALQRQVSRLQKQLDLSLASSTTDALAAADISHH